MNRPLTFYQVVGFIFTSIAGTLLHFAYDWSNQSIFFAPFSAVNESIWEHMKLLFFPMFIFALIESRIVSKQYPNFWCAKLAGIVLGLTLIPVLYYTYTGVLGVSADWVNILIFFLSAAAAYYLEYILFKNRFFICKTPKLAFVIICLIGLAFVILTFIQPKIPLFQAPDTMTYGLN